jgi:hypothetical protein
MFLFPDLFKIGDSHQNGNCLLYCMSLDGFFKTSSEHLVLLALDCILR